MATVCYTRPTLTSARVITSYSVATLTRNVVYTSPGRTSTYISTSRSCTVRSAQSVCRTYRSTRISILPSQRYTSVVRDYTSRAVYITNRVTLYSTSCSVRRPTPTPTPRPTPPPRPVTTYITTTRTTGVAVPVTTTETLGVTDSTTTTETPDVITTTDVSGFTIVTTATETVSENTDAPLPQGGGTPGPRKVPLGAIVGGTLGGLVAAIILGFLIYFMCFRRTKKGLREKGGRSLDHQQSISLSALDGRSSPTEGSSAFNSLQDNGARQANLDGRQGSQFSHLPHNQELGVLHANLDGAQAMQYHTTSQESHNMAQAGHRYSHLRQDSLGGQAVIAMPMGPSTEQGYSYPQPLVGQYLGHAEVQDSRW